MKESLPPLALPSSFNYVGVFLTFACNLHCSYCLNDFAGKTPAVAALDGTHWLAILNRLQTRPDLPVTLQGGEPTAHPDFYNILDGLRADLPLDLLTNLRCDIDEFRRRVRPDRFRHNTPYASIRVSFHPEQKNYLPLLQTVAALRRDGYPVGIWGVLHPDYRERVLAAQQEAQALGIDFRTKDFLGHHDGKLYGTYAYPDAVGSTMTRTVQCRPSELLIAPDGKIYRCHRDLYAGEGAVGDAADPACRISDAMRPCTCYGQCHPCDLKVKNNRYQQFGHTSVAIEFTGDGR